MATLGLQGFREEVLPNVDLDGVELTTGVSQLRELLREAAGLGHEIGNMHHEQLERIAALIKAQRENATELKRSPLRTQLTRMWQLLTPSDLADYPVLGELQRWLENGSAACDLALEQSLLAECWLVRVGHSLRSAQAISSRLPGFFRTRRTILGQLRTQQGSCLSEGGADAQPVSIEGPISRIAGTKAKREDEESEPMEEEQMEEVQQVALRRWDARKRFLLALQQLREQDTELLWILRNGGAEVQLQMLPELPGLLAPEPSHGIAEHGIAADLALSGIGPADEADEMHPSSRMRTLSIHADGLVNQPPPETLSPHAATTINTPRARLHAALGQLTNLAYPPREGDTPPEAPCFPLGILSASEAAGGSDLVGSGGVDYYCRESDLVAMPNLDCFVTACAPLPLEPAAAHYRKLAGRKVGQQRHSSHARAPYPPA